MVKPSEAGPVFSTLATALIEYFYLVRAILKRVPIFLAQKQELAKSVFSVGLACLSMRESQGRYAVIGVYNEMLHIGVHVTPGTPLQQTLALLFTAHGANLTMRVLGA